jgi:hypothetical protein
VIVQPARAASAKTEAAVNAAAALCACNKEALTREAKRPVKRRR